MAKAPVCGMTVDSKSPHTSTHAGQTYVFCCATCKTKFDTEPGRYAAAAGAEVQRGSRP
jgi:Cu+-exporting ATPase